MTSPAEPLEAAIAALARALRSSGAPFMLIGGVAVIVRGVARVTTDVDATVRADGLDLDELIRRLAAQGIVGRIPDLLEFARANQVLLLRHDETGTPIEVSLAWLPFEQEALARAEVVELPGTSVPVAQAEDLVIYKAVAHRDPGVPNWLDTGGQLEGILQYRWVWSRTNPEPSARVVKYEALGSLLPSGTRRVTPEERRAAIHERQRHVGRREPAT